MIAKTDNTEQTCTKCRKVKSVSEFYIEKMCKVCKKLKVKYRYGLKKARASLSQLIARKARADTITITEADKANLAADCGLEVSDIDELIRNGELDVDGVWEFTDEQIPRN